MRLRSLPCRLLASMMASTWVWPSGWGRHHRCVAHAQRRRARASSCARVHPLCLTLVTMAFSLARWARMARTLQWVAEVCGQALCIAGPGLQRAQSHSHMGAPALHGPHGRLEPPQLLVKLVGGPVCGQGRACCWALGTHTAAADSTAAASAVCRACASCSGRAHSGTMCPVPRPAPPRHAEASPGGGSVRVALFTMQLLHLQRAGGCTS